MERTINGLTIKEVMEKLQADFDKSVIKERDYDGVKYISVDDYRDRLNQVIGTEHYNELYDEVKVIVTKDTYTTSTKCRLEFLDDNYEVILVKESAGGSIVAFPKVSETITSVDEKFIKHENTVKSIKDGKEDICKVVGTTTTSIPNDIDSACQDAFKRICRKSLGMGKKQLEEAKKGIVYIVNVVKSNPYKDMIFGELKYNNTDYKLAVFKNNTETFKKAYGSDTLKNKTIAFYGKETVDKYGKPQLIFEKASELPPTNTNAEVEKATTTPPVQNTKPAANTTSNPQPQSENKELEILTTSLLTPYGNYGYFYVKGIDKKNNNYGFVFQPNELANSKDWELFKQQAGSSNKIMVTISYKTIKDKLLVNDVKLKSA